MKPLLFLLLAAVALLNCSVGTAEESTVDHDMAFEIALHLPEVQAWSYHQISSTKTLQEIQKKILALDNQIKEIKENGHGPFRETDSLQKTALELVSYIYADAIVFRGIKIDFVYSSAIPSILKDENEEYKKRYSYATLKYAKEILKAPEVARGIEESSLTRFQKNPSFRDFNTVYDIMYTLAHFGEPAIRRVLDRRMNRKLSKTVNCRALLKEGQGLSFPKNAPAPRWLFRS